MNTLQDKAIGTLMGAAVGDAIGGATEGRSTQEIVERYDGYVEGIVDYFMPDWRTAKPMSPYHKGEGNVTDGTLMTNLLVAVYAKNRRHLTAFDMADDPRMASQPCLPARSFLTMADADVVTGMSASPSATLARFSAFMK